MRILLLFVGAMLAATGVLAKEAPPKSELEILQNYAKDYLKDQYFVKRMTFGVKINERFYTVETHPAKDTQEADISVKPGAPSEPTFYFTIADRQVLYDLDAGRVNALTLMGKAVDADYAPMDVEVMDGFVAPDWFSSDILPFTFHFWTRGNPEVVSYAEQKTRFVHGANMGVFYYQPGLRSAWFDIRKGQHVNEGEADSSNPFPSMFILVKGELDAQIGGKEFHFTAGNMLFVPAGVSHEFVNKHKDNAQGFLFMFGDGA